MGYSSLGRDNMLHVHVGIGILFCTIDFLERLLLKDP